jgi:hypothetical protein
MKWRLTLLLLLLTFTDAPATCECMGLGVLSVHDAGLLYAASNGSVSVCAQGTNPTSGPQMDMRIDGAVDEASAKVFKVYVVFPSGCHYGLYGAAWGIHYPAGIHVVGSGMCGDFELPDAGWPASGTGNSVTWNVAQNIWAVPMYWFAAYNDGPPATFDLAPNPSQGAVMAGDWVPAILDHIYALGKIGFGTDGENVSLDLVAGACCRTNGQCTLGPWAECWNDSAWNVWHPDRPNCAPNPCGATQGACCTAAGGCAFGPSSACTGYYLGQGSVCTPNPCPQPTAIDRVTWGKVKDRYRP